MQSFAPVTLGDTKLHHATKSVGEKPDQSFYGKGNRCRRMPQPDLPRGRAGRGIMNPADLTFCRKHR
jgi:hypothetical protein